MQSATPATRFGRDRTRHPPCRRHRRCLRRRLRRARPARRDLLRHPRPRPRAHRLLPRRLRRPRGADPRARWPPCGRRAQSTTREQAAQDAFVERRGRRSSSTTRTTPQSQVSVIASELHAIRSVFDLMDTDGEEAWTQHRRPARGSAGGARRLPRDADSRRPTSGHVSATRQIGWSPAGPAWTGQDGNAGDFFAHLVAGPKASRRPRGSSLDAARHGGQRRPSPLRRFLDRRAAPRGPRQDAVGRDRYAPESRYFLGADVDLDETYAWGWDELARIEDEMAARRRADRPRRLRRRRGRRARRRSRRAGSTAGAPSGTGCRSWPTAPSPTWPTSTSTSPSRSAGSSAGSRRPTTAASTTPARARTSAGRAGCGGRCPTASTRFSTWREVTTVYHEGVPGHHLQVAQTAYRTRPAQPLAAAACAGCPATARAGRCTPSG